MYQEELGISFTLHVIKMKKLFGIALVLVGVFSGGIGIGVMGGGLAIPSFLVIAFGIYLFASPSNEKNIDSNSIVKKLSSIFLGILILIFGFVNLLNGSLIVVSLLAILLGGVIIFLAFSGTKKNENKPQDLKSRIREKVKSDVKKKQSGWVFLFYAIIIPGLILGILILIGF